MAAAITDIIIILSNVLSYYKTQFIVSYKTEAMYNMYKEFIGM